MSGGIYTGLDAFRNARPDAETKNLLTTTPKYLYGIPQGTSVYWGGGLVAPTGYHASVLPYALMLATGLLLGAGMLLLPRRRRRGGG